MRMLEGLAREVVARWERGDLAQTVRALDRHLRDIAEDRVRHADLIERAIDLYQDDDIQIDAQGSFISQSETGEKGAFVMGWLWVPRPDGDIARLTVECPPDECPTAGTQADVVTYPEEGARSR